MTREELKEHCEKQIENCEMWARCIGEEPHGKIYEEHKLILELLEQEPCEDAISRQAVLKYIEGSEAELGHDSENELVCQDIKELPPVAPKLCEVLDKIIVEIEQVAEEESKFNIKGARGLKHALKIINKYKAEMEGKDTDNTRDCNNCAHSNGGRCAGTEVCHECMWSNKFIKADKRVIDPSNFGRFDMRMINRGKCVLCGKELTEGLFFCKECEAKAGR